MSEKTQRIRIKTLPGEGLQECVCMSKAKYSKVRSALKIGLEAMKFGGFYDKTPADKQILRNIETFIRTV